MSEKCEHCNTELKAWEYLSPLWVGRHLLPACLVVSCECEACFDYAETAYRGETIYSFPDAGVSQEVIEQQWAKVRAVPASEYEADLQGAQS